MNQANNNSNASHLDGVPPTAGGGALSGRGGGNGTAATDGGGDRSPTAQLKTERDDTEDEEGDAEGSGTAYRDFATTPVPTTGGSSPHPQSLQAQKLPAKLASMLSDPGEFSHIKLPT